VLRADILSLCVVVVNFSGKLSTATQCREYSETLTANVDTYFSFTWQLPARYCFVATCLFVTSN